jgi:hypothetical protein
MNILSRVSKVFAVPFLIFLNFVAVIGQTEQIYKVPAGTRLHLSMDLELSSKVAAVNDTFTATVAKPLVLSDSVVLPVGTVIEGRVTHVSSADIGGKNGQLQVRFETMRFADNQRRRIEGLLVRELKARASRTSALLSIVGGTAAGAILGAASKVDNGALLGAGIGAGAGTSIAFLRKGKDVYIRTDEEFEIELKSDVTLPINEY